MQFKRTLAMLLAMVMVLGMLPATAFATDGAEAMSDSTDIPNATDPSVGDEGVGDWEEEDTYPSVTLDQPFQVTLESGEELCYRFTAPQDGFYSLYVPAYTVDGQAYFCEVWCNSDVPYSTRGDASADGRVGVHNIFYFSGGDAVELTMYNNTGVRLTHEPVMKRLPTVGMNEAVDCTIQPGHFAYIALYSAEAGAYAMTTTGIDRGDGEVLFPECSTLIATGEYSSYYAAVDGTIRYSMFDLGTDTFALMQLYNLAGETVTTTVGLEKSPTITAVSLDCESVKGKPGDTFTVTARVEPGYSMEKVEFSINNGDVAEIEWCGDTQCGIKLLSGGDAVLTATAASGASDSVTIRVATITSMESGMTYEATLEPDDSSYYTFTPEESGVYCFAVPYLDEGDVWHTAGLSIDTGNYTGDAGSQTINGRYVYYYELIGGEEIVLRLYNGTDRTLSTSVTAFALPVAQTLTLSREEISGKQGEQMYLEVMDFSPAEARLSLSWEIRHPDVAEILYTEDRGVMICLVSGGETELIVTNCDGAVFTFPITVEATPKLMLNETAMPTLQPDQTVEYLFTAEEAGIYRFFVPCVNIGDSGYPCMLGVNGYSGSWNQFTSTMVDGGDCQICWLEAGTTVKVSVYNQFGLELTPCLSATVPPAAEELAVGDINLLIGTSVNHTPAVGPEGCWSKLYFNVKDENIVRIAEATYGNVTLEAVGVGSTTLTVTSENGLSASCTVTVSGYTDIELNETAELSMEGGQANYFRFTAPAEGVYTFKTPVFYDQGNVYYADLWEYTSYGDTQSLVSQRTDSYNYVHFRMEKDAVLILWLQNSHEEYTLATTLTAEEGVAATGMVFAPNVIEGKQQSHTSFRLQFLPEGAYCENYPQYFIDGSAAFLNEWNGTQGNLYLSQEGTATLFATCGDWVATAEIRVAGNTKLELGMSYHTSFGPGEGEALEFTAPETGIYMFYTPNYYVPEWDGIYHGEMHQQYDDPRIRFLDSRTLDSGLYHYYRMEAGSKIVMWLYNPYSVTMASALTVTKAPTPAVLYFRQNHNAGSEGDLLHFDVAYEPQAAYCQLDVSLSDPAMAQIEEMGGSWFTVRLLEAGEVTVTASCGGMSVSQTIRVTKPLYLKEGAETQLTLAPGQSADVLFTAPETGVYVFHAPTVRLDDGSTYYWMYCNGSIVNANGNGTYSDYGWTTNGLGFIRRAYIEEGVTLRLLVNNESWAGFTAPVLVARAVEPTDIVLDMEEIRTVPGMGSYVSYYLAPFNAWGEVTWSVPENNGVVSISGVGDSYCNLNTLDIGQTTLTATCGSLSKEIPVIVENPPELKLDEEYTVEGMYGYQVFRFKAPETGIYGFRTPFITGVDEYGVEWAGYANVEYNTLPKPCEFLDQYVYDGYAVRYIYMEKDKTAELVLTWYGGGKVDTSVTPVKATTPTDVYFDIDRITLVPGEEVCIRLNLESGCAYAPIQWSCDREGLEWWAPINNRNELQIYAHSEGTWVITANVNGTVRTLTVVVSNASVDVVTPKGVQMYGSLAEAIANAQGGYVRLTNHITENITVTADTYLDLNGCTLYGNVTVEEGATLYCFDSATADYTADCRGGIRGIVTGNLARSLNTPLDSYGHNYKYMAIREEGDLWTFHRYYLTVKSVILAPCMEAEDHTGTAVNYRTVFKCNEVALEYITAHGAKFEGEETVYADYFAAGYKIIPGSYENMRVASLGGTMRTSNTDAQNAFNAMLAPTVRAYITLSDGTTLESAPVSRSLQQMAAYANGLSDLTEPQKQALGRMYDMFKRVMDSFSVDIDNIKAYAAQYCGTDTAEVFAILLQPESVTALPDSSAVFAVHASGEGLTYQWRAKAPDGSWTNATVSGMSGYKTDTLTVTVSEALDGYTLCCIVRDANNKRIDTETVTLTVR